VVSCRSAWHGQIIFKIFSRTTVALIHSWHLKISSRVVTLVGQDSKGQMETIRRPLHSGGGHPIQVEANTKWLPATSMGWKPETAAQLWSWHTEQRHRRVFYVSCDKGERVLPTLVEYTELWDWLFRWGDGAIYRSTLATHLTRNNPWKLSCFRGYHISIIITCHNTIIKKNLGWDTHREVLV